MPMTLRFLQLVSAALFMSVLDGPLAAPAYCQERIPTDVPCKDSMAFKAKGKWIKGRDITTGSDLSLETKKRLDQVQEMIAGIYASPTGVDAVWHRAQGTGLFAKEINHANGIPVGGYYYRSGFFYYYCDPYSKNQMIAGYPGETNTWIQVSANCNFPWGAGIADEGWAIDRRPVLRRHPLREMWKGYPMFQNEAGSNTRYVLIHRKGMLPYIPVTRKQYLEHAIKHLSDNFDRTLNTLRQMPVRPLEEQEAERKQTLEKYEKNFGKDPKRLKSATDYYLSGYQTDQQRRDQDVNKAIKQKNEVLNRYQDELEKTTSEGLLDSPATVLLVHSPDTTTPIFITESENSNGSMLITENPAYIRKDLPKYVPQVIVLHWSWNNSEPQKYINQVIVENFPIEKLQAMIDR